ncbi:MAG: leucine-rich repeat domain-containing protein [Treponema sp.]|jgi:hypothetical protein|nr:leucine-rich repeat domain-containing protein [Treponema sp.]
MERSIITAGGASGGAACLEAHLRAQAANTVAAPYTVVLPAITFSETDTADSAWAKISGAVRNAGKYVILDLCNCTFQDNTVSSETGQVIQDNTYIKGIILPKGLTTIGRGAFNDCTSLAGVGIPPGVTSIGNEAFYYCIALASVDIPPGVTSIGNEAFYYCIALTSVDIPEGVTSIGDDVFGGCSALASIRIPASLASIGQTAFAGCTALTSITVDGANSAYCSEDGVLFNKARTTLIRYPAGKSGPYAIPAGVTSIGDKAFSYCPALTGVIIPADVVSIGQFAFGWCSRLTSVTFEGGGIAGFGNNSFQNGPDGGSALKELYQEGGAGTYTRPTGGSAWTKRQSAVRVDF